MKQNIIVIEKTGIPDLEVCLYDLCKVSEASDMTTLSVGKILDEHKTGYVRVVVAEEDDGEYSPLWAVGYAGYTKDRAYGGDLYAQIGGVVCLPGYRGNGHMKDLVRRILDTPLPDEYVGFAAVGNQMSQNMLTSLGMVQVDMVPSESTGVLHPLLTLNRSQLPEIAVE